VEALLTPSVKRDYYLLGPLGLTSLVYRYIGVMLFCHFHSWSGPNDSYEHWHAGVTATAESSIVSFIIFHPTQTYIECGNCCVDKLLFSTVCVLHWLWLWIRLRTTRLCKVSLSNAQNGTVNENHVRAMLQEICCLTFVDSLNHWHAVTKQFLRKYMAISDSIRLDVNPTLKHLPENLTFRLQTLTSARTKKSANTSVSTQSAAIGVTAMLVSSWTLQTEDRA